MGLPRWLPGPLLLLLLLLCCSLASRASDVRYLRHGGGRREAGDGPGAVNTTEAPGDVVLEEEEERSGGLEELVVVRGQKLLLECQVPEHVTAVPGDESVEGEVRWYHDGVRQREDLRVSIMWTGRLVVSHAVVGDSGVWWCRRSSRPGPRTRLLVTIPPERPYLMFGGAQLAAGARLTTREGNTLTLHCVVDGGNPAPHITWLMAARDVTPASQVRTEWREEENQYHSVSNLTMATTGREQHNTTVACVVRHPSLPRPVPVSLILNIEYSPDFRLRRWPVWGTPVREGSAVSLLCIVDANPPSIPTWIKVPLMPSPTPRRPTETEGGAREVSSSGGWLNLTRARPEDRGWYKCATTHSFGHFASHSVFINVLGEGASGGGIHTPQLLRKTASTSSSTQAGLHPACPHHPSAPGASDSRPALPGWVAVVAINSSVVTVGGGSAMLAARVCGHPRPSPSALTWLPPDHLPPIRPGDTKDRLRAHNLTAGSGGCRRATLSVTGVRNSDAGAWVLVAAGRHHADAALIRLNVTGAAHTVAASAAHALLPALLLPALLPFCCLAPRP